MAMLYFLPMRTDSLPSAHWSVPMSDQPVQDQDVAGRLRQVREEVRAETAPSFAETMRQQHDADCLYGDRDLQLYPQLQQHLAEAIARHQVREQPFRSTVPLVGPLVAWFRGLWNRVSTTWYVRPLLEQQVAYNAAVANALQDLHHYVQVSSYDMVRRTDALFHIAQQEAAVLAARCDDLQAGLHAVQESLEQLQAALPASAAEAPGEAQDLAGLAARLEHLAGVVRRMGDHG
jgi:hypothetical protein